MDKYHSSLPLAPNIYFEPFNEEITIEYKTQLRTSCFKNFTCGADFKKENFQEIKNNQSSV